MPSFRLETVIAAPVADCFDLSLSVGAHTASMGPSGERAVGGVTAGLMGPGDTVTWRARHVGIPFRMTSAITAYERPSRFVDEQQQGPFGSWWHEHVFSPTDAGGTLMVDVVRFRSPLGPLGRLADAVVLGRYLPHLLRQRNAWLRAELEGRRGDSGPGDQQQGAARCPCPDRANSSNAPHVKGREVDGPRTDLHGWTGKRATGVRTRLHHRRSATPGDPCGAAPHSFACPWAQREPTAGVIRRPRPARAGP